MRSILSILILCVGLLLGGCGDARVTATTYRIDAPGITPINDGVTRVYMVSQATLDAIESGRGQEHPGHYEWQTALYRPGESYVYVSDFTQSEVFPNGLAIFVWNKGDDDLLLKAITDDMRIAHRDAKAELAALGHGLPASAYELLASLK